MKLLNLFNIVLLTGLLVSYNEVKYKAVQGKTEWVAATVNGIVLGKSTYEDIIRLWGKPFNEAEFAGDPVEPEENIPTPELLTELHYRNIEIDDERVNAGVLVGNETRLVRTISYFPEGFTKDGAIRKHGSDYYLVTTQESTCINKNDERKQNRELNPTDYPIKLVYPKKGLLVQVSGNNTIMSVNYGDKCIE